MEPGQHEPSPPTASAEPAAEAAVPLPVLPFPASGASELVADLIEATRLVPAVRLALVRGRARQGGSFAEALVAEGLAASDGVARMLAARHRLPLGDLRLTGVAADAAVLVPLHVLRRAVALPYRLEGESLHVAIADPQNVQAIDELRLATRYRLAIGVAARDDIVAELRPPRPGENHVDLLGARVAVGEALAPPGLDPMVADPGLLRLEIAVGEASLLIVLVAEAGRRVVDIG